MSCLKRFFSSRRWIAFVEILLIFGVFAAYGAWPVPDVNEQYYVGKAIHFWNPNWLGNDPFLNTPDSHWFFYASFGLLSFVFSQNSLVWAGRILIWFATACAWRRLSRALVPRRWISVLTAAVFAFYLESFHLAGEWIVGGVEGKGFAFPFVFWGLALFLEGKYNRAWILYGIAAAFHVLVGGWVVVASLVAWALSAHREYGETLKNATRPNNESKIGVFKRLGKRGAGFANAFLKTLPGLFVGGAISLFGLVPALRLDAGASPEIVAESRRIYVFERLSHHLVASSLPWTFLTRFGLLALAFALVVGLTFFLKRRSTPTCDASESDGKTLEKLEKEETARYFRLEAFVVAALAIAGVGLTIDFGSKYLAATGRLGDPKAAAGLLRYYWYRLSDWAVPLGVVFGVARWTTFDGFWRNVAIFGDRDREKTANFGALFFWATLGLGVYWAFRSVFFRTAAASAAASAVGGLVPLPKPTEGVAFLATIDFFGVVFFLTASGVAIFRRWRRNRDRADSATIVRFVATGWAFWTAAALLVAPVCRLTNFVDLRATKVVPRSAPPKESIADGWLDVCRWVRENTPNDAIFLVPRGCDSFKWEARRAEAGSWKEIPQDAKSIVRWYRKMERFYATGPKSSPTRWNQPLVVVFLNKGRAKILEESAKYGYDYAIVENPPYALTAIPEAARRFQEFVDADQVYRNDQFVVLRLRQDEISTSQQDENSTSQQDENSTSRQDENSTSRQDENREEDRREDGRERK